MGRCGVNRKLKVPDMAHIGDLLTLLGAVLALPTGFMLGYWVRGRRSRMVI